MTLRVLVLRFDRLAPALDHLEEVALEASGHAVQVRDVALCAQLGEHAVSAVELLECLAVAALSAIELAALAGDFSEKKRLLALVSEYVGALEVLLGTHILAQLTAD